jgi:hypothetical protein
MVAEGEWWRFATTMPEHINGKVSGYGEIVAFGEVTPGGSTLDGGRIPCPVGTQLVKLCNAEFCYTIPGTFLVEHIDPFLRWAQICPGIPHPPYLRKLMTRIIPPGGDLCHTL